MLPEDHVFHFGRLAVAKGGKTRAILKLLGRGAIAITWSLIDVALALMWAAANVLGLLTQLATDERRAVLASADTDQEERDRGRADDIWLLSDELAHQFRVAAQGELTAYDTHRLYDTITPTAVAIGNMVMITITVVNHGPSDASGVVVTDALPPGLTFLSGTAAGGSSTTSPLTPMIGNAENVSRHTTAVAVDGSVLRIWASRLLT